MFQFQGFTQKANTALNLALESAEKLGHSYVGTEHILLGLINEGSGVAAAALKNCGVTAQSVEEKIKSVSGVGAPTDLSPNDFTPRTKRVLQSALMLSSRMGQSYVGTEHLLLAVISESDSYAVSFLNELGVSRDRLAQAIGSGMQQGGAQAEAVGGFAPQGAEGESGESALDKFGRDLTKAAKSGEIDPVSAGKRKSNALSRFSRAAPRTIPC